MTIDINNRTVQKGGGGNSKQAVYIKRGMLMSQMHRFSTEGKYNFYSKCKICGKRKESKFHI